MDYVIPSLTFSYQRGAHDSKYSPIMSSITNQISSKKYAISSNFLKAQNLKRFPNKYIRTEESEMSKDKNFLSINRTKKKKRKNSLAKNKSYCKLYVNNISLRAMKIDTLERQGKRDKSLLKRSLKKSFKSTSGVIKDMFLRRRKGEETHLLNLRKIPKNTSQNHNHKNHMKKHSKTKTNILDVKSPKKATTILPKNKSISNFSHVAGDMWTLKAIENSKVNSSYVNQGTTSPKFKQFMASKNGSRK